jgi:phosphopantothenoylcysteine decarboxylase/phosphopantothenate--cysteine ligase
MFFEKKILVGVTGGIAAYKTCEIIRELKRNHAEIQVVMTNAAMGFITPLTLATLSENPVLTEMFGESYSTSTVHIEAARWADAVLVCPATANTIGKIASGIADNLLTTLVMATTSPVIFCPAMNKEMYANAIYQQNVEKLKQTGYHFVESEVGELACGEFGWGRLADSIHIINKLKKVLLSTDELKGKKVLVTAGRTEEPLDPVRFITNYSSGKMGFAIAETAALKSAAVTLISGPNNLIPFDDIKYLLVQTSDQMAETVVQSAAEQDVIIMAAAVADFKPEIYFDHKIKKMNLASTINLVKTKDILKEIGKHKGTKILVGFAVETENELENAKRKLVEKNLDLIVLNNPLEQGAAFGGDTNVVTFIDVQGNSERFPMMSKREVAVKVLDRVVHLMKE